MFTNELLSSVSDARTVKSGLQTDAKDIVKPPTQTIFNKHCSRVSDAQESHYGLQTATKDTAKPFIRAISSPASELFARSCTIKHPTTELLAPTPELLVRSYTLKHHTAELLARIYAL